MGIDSAEIEEKSILGRHSITGEHLVVDLVCRQAPENRVRCFIDDEDFFRCMAEVPNDAAFSMF